MKSQNIPSLKTVALATLALTAVVAPLAMTAALGATSIAQVAGLGFIGGLSLIGELVFARYAFVEVGKAEADGRRIAVVVPFAGKGGASRSARAA